MPADNETPQPAPCGSAEPHKPHRTCGAPCEDGSHVCSGIAAPIAQQSAGSETKSLDADHPALSAAQADLGEANTRPDEGAGPSESVRHAARRESRDAGPVRPPVQAALLGSVPDKIEKWPLYAFEDPEGEVYVAASVEDVIAACGVTDFHAADFKVLDRDVILGNDETGDRVVIGEALDRIEAGLTTNPLGRGIIDQIRTYYA